MTAISRIGAPVAIYILLALDGTVVSPDSAADESSWIELSESDQFGQWRESTGDWFAVGEVSLNRLDPSTLAVGQGHGAMVNGFRGRTRHLVSRLKHGDLEAHVEFLVPEGSNSGIYFQGRYEIQILDSFGVEEPKFSDCGGIYQRWDEGRGFEGHPPRLNASRAPGVWQTFDIIFRAPRFDKAGKKITNARFEKVTHNGYVVHEHIEVTGPTRAAMFDDERARGPLMFQGDHGPVALRNLRVRHLAGKAE